ncbi:LYR motif-containing protein 7 isoform 2 [Rhynchospora pubera]|uniref:LYR motif-containing protein 7 isoform 2 n=1 Tax=Rhynchospora pubera TaxID=906938 RepID=A0AAV8EC70_9POAL|nr:LYR motif-containing protein 7 isoform 2 [Rhynchospora pubera]
MTPRTTTRSQSHQRSNSKPSLIESVAHQLHSWKPFQLHQTLIADPSKSKPYLFPTKKPCRSDRSTAPDLSCLTLREDPNLPASASASATSRPREDPFFLQDGYKRWFARKRRRRGSRSVSGRSSDRSTTHVTPLTCTAATCSDSSGELMSWGSDVSEVRIPRHRDHNSALSFAAEKDGAASASASASGLVGAAGLGQEKDLLPGNESGYGSEPGYRGDGEFGYGDEFDEEDEFDVRHLLFWGDHRIRDGYQRGMEGKNKIGELKSHHRNRRKKIII